MKLIVGLTGGIGSGKSSVGRLFEQRGIAVIDADAEAHALTAPGGAAMPMIKEAFGGEFVRSDGALDRARMREHVFSDSGVKRRLEGILHPMIRARTEAAVNAASSPYVILMIPLLVESGLPRARCQRILVVDVPEAKQIERVMARDHISAEIAGKILVAQASRTARLKEADDVIDNAGAPAALVAQVERLDRVYLRLARGERS